MDFFKQMRYYFIYFRIFGLWSSWENPKHKWLLRIYLFLSITIVAVSYPNAILFELGSNFLRGTVNTVLFIFISVSVLTIIIETLLNANDQIQLIERCSMVDHIFSTKLGVIIPYHGQKRKLFIQHCILASLVLLTILIMLIYVHFISRNFLNFLCFEFYFTFITRLRLLQVLFFVCLVRDRLKLIHQELMKIQNLEKWLNGFPLASNTIITLNNRPLKNSTYDRCLYLKQIYGHLYETYELISKAFGLSLLTIITQCVIDFIINCYSTFQYLSGTSYTAKDLVPLTIIIFMVGVFFTIFTTLTFYCSSCSQYVRLIFIYY